MQHRESSMISSSFWWELVGKVGAPIFSATLVVCLLSGEFAISHGVLLAVGFSMMAVCHWRSQH